MLLPNALALIGVQLLDLALDVVDLGELLQREPGNLGFVGRMQVKEFAPRMRQAADPERVNDFATPSVMNLLCRAVDCGWGVSPEVAG